MSRLPPPPRAIRYSPFQDIEGDTLLYQDDATASGLRGRFLRDYLVDKNIFNYLDCTMKRARAGLFR